MCSCKRFALVALLALPAPQSALSADTGNRELGRGFQVGGFRLYPSAGLSLGYESNVTLTHDDTVDSFTTRLSPALHAETGNKSNLFSFDLASNLAWYTESNRDDFADVTARGNWLYNPVLRHTFAFDAGVTFSHDPRGTGAREGDLALLDLDPDRYRRSDIGGQYTFGAPGARARIEVDGRFVDRTYTNNRAFTRFRDQQQTGFGGAFFWRIAPKTSATFRVEQGNFDYDSATLDNTERHYFIGLDFDPTAKLSGQALVGHLSKNFDDPARDDTSGASWRVGVKYAWRTYSSFSLTTTRETDETNGTGDFILRRDVTLGWTHNWSERVSTAVDTGFSKDEHLPTIREDKTTFIGVSADYLFRPWLRAGASYRTFNRSSDINEFDYNRDLFLISLEASL